MTRAPFTTFTLKADRLLLPDKYATRPAPSSFLSTTCLRTFAKAWYVLWSPTALACFGCLHAMQHLNQLQLTPNVAHGNMPRTHCMLALLVNVDVCVYGSHLLHCTSHPTGVCTTPKCVAMHLATACNAGFNMPLDVPACEALERSNKRLIVGCCLCWQTHVCRLCMQTKWSACRVCNVCSRKCHCLRTQQLLTPMRLPTLLGH